MATRDITKPDIELFIKHGTVILDFWASWCGPCKMLSPIIEDLSESHKIGKVQIDDPQNDGVTDEYNIQSVPTVVVYRDGIELGRFSGYKSRATVRDLVWNFMNNQ